MLSDVEIARSIKPTNIYTIAKKLGLDKSLIEPYGKSMAKIDYLKIQGKEKGKLILVTAINPTASGEGKTTVSIGLADALKRMGKNVCLALREPSLGPVFGVKGGATGGGYSQVVPMENINLHFTGDFHAITSANNLLSAIIDNHIYQGNELGIEKVYFERCFDANDRNLKSITLASGRNDRFTITSACEIMAVLTLAKDLKDLKRRLGNIIVGENKEGKLVFARDLKAADAMAILLKDALKPNLVQTLEHTPALIHLGPFANIAHGCNSIIATKTALKLADYVVTEAGFGADLGAEKFLDLKCQLNGLKPNCVVVVATVKALKLHGGEDKSNLGKENLDALKKGIGNLERHINNIKNIYKLPIVVALNKFATDTQAEIDYVVNFVSKMGVQAEVSTAFADGSKGATMLAEKVLQKCNGKSKMEFAYTFDQPVKDKINAIATKIYGATGVSYSDEAKEMLKIIKKNGYDKLPVVIAKTQYSFSDNKDLLGAPTNFDINIRELKIRGGAEFIVAVAGNMLLMPGLAKHSAYEKMTIDENGIINGLF